MTDVQTTLEGYCDHVFSPDEAEAKAYELLELADAARRTILTAAHLIIERGLITEQHIGEIIAEFHPVGSRKWKLNKTRLWWLITCKSFRFTRMCFHCATPLRGFTCDIHGYAPAVSIDELSEHADFFRNYSYSIHQYYSRLLLRVSTHKTA